MQNLVKNEQEFTVEIEATCHSYLKPFVKVMEMLFNAGDAVELGKTTLFVKDNKGAIIHQEYFGKSRKGAWHRRLEIEEKIRTLSKEEFLSWLKGKN